MTNIAILKKKIPICLTNVWNTVLWNTPDHPPLIDFPPNLQDVESNYETISQQKWLRSHGYFPTATTYTVQSVNISNLCVMVIISIESKDRGSGRKRVKPGGMCVRYVEYGINPQLVQLVKMKLKDPVLREQVKNMLQGVTKE